MNALGPGEYFYKSFAGKSPDFAISWNSGLFRKTSRFTEDIRCKLDLRNSVNLRKIGIPDRKTWYLNNPFHFFFNRISAQEHFFQHIQDIFPLNVFSHYPQFSNLDLDLGLRCVADHASVTTNTRDAKQQLAFFSLYF